jgi:mono/diheme cytochrome c family protein
MPQPLNVPVLARVLPVILVASLALCQAVGQTSAPKVPADHAERMAKGQELFTKHVRKILSERCLQCHGGDKIKGDFDLSSRESLLRGAGEIKVVIPYHARDSRLVKLIAHQDDPKMPYKQAKLADAEITHIKNWIELGAPYDKPLVEKVAVTKAMTVTDADRKFWSFQPLKRPPLPKVKNDTWCKTPIDRFILAKLEDKEIEPNALVDRRVLIRRAYFDLIGLPPAPEEVDAFVRDAKPQAVERLIDRLLANPHYGERWARHWLDLARFAESSGYEHDYDRPFAYHYRDFVIKALNSDLPYNTFVQWQIAGDEYAPDNPLAMMATGFLAAGTHSTQTTVNLVEKERYEQLDDKLRTLGTAMLGLTIGCARCHDHKYDPIPTLDYYRMLATFTTTVKANVDVNLDAQGYKEAKAKFDATQRKLLEPLRRYEAELQPRFDGWLADRPLLDDLPRWGQPRGKLSDTERQWLFRWYRTLDASWRQLHQKVAEHRKTEPKPLAAKALIASEGVPPLRMHSQGADFFEQTYFLKRGDTDQKDGVVTQSFLQVLTRHADGEKRWQTPPPQGWRTSYRRRALAEWVTEVEHGAGHLLARVIVNRLWQHHLGQGIVTTPSDFGFQGEPPSHPELLDWLARELIDNGWSLKHIHKLIMTSAVYQQSSQRDPKKVQADSDNRLFWHKPRQRLEAEIIRDAMLSVSGTLDARQFGPGTLDQNHKRRSIYFFVKRSKLIPTMMLFDAPDALQGMERRPTTTVAPQALLVLNSALVRGYAESFARRIDAGANMSLPDVVRSGYRVALGRTPSPVELRELVEFLREQTASYQAERREHARHLAVADFCQVLLGLNEFVYVD